MSGNQLSLNHQYCGEHRFLLVMVAIDIIRTFYPDENSLPTNPTGVQSSWRHETPIKPKKESVIGVLRLLIGVSIKNNTLPFLLNNNIALITRKVTPLGWKCNRVKFPFRTILWSAKWHRECPHVAIKSHQWLQKSRFTTQTADLKFRFGLLKFKLVTVSLCARRELKWIFWQIKIFQHISRSLIRSTILKCASKILSHATRTPHI